MLKNAVCVAALLLLAMVPSGLHAQPGMPDPSQMSGIPRPDPKVPSGTVTVRLIRGTFANRLTDVAVQLESAGAAPGTAPLTQNSNAEGRAIFASLSPGTYVAKATVDGQTLSSQPITVDAAPAPGIAVMLVFAKSAAEQQAEVGTPDGKARMDSATAAGTLVVKLVDESAKPLPGLLITLVTASRGSEKVEAAGSQPSGADGTAKFEGLKSGSDIGYLIAVERDGGRQQSQPFQLSAEHGSVLAMTVRAITRDRAGLKLGPSSHIIFEPQDDSVQIIENLQLQNSQDRAVDPGPAGLRVPLAVGALSPQVMPGGPPQLTVDASQAGPPVLLWKGPIPPGDTALSVGFVLKHHGTLKFQQQMAVAADGIRIVAIKLPDLKIDGVSDSEDRKWNGRDLVVASAIVPGAGGSLEITLHGLPTDFYQLRIIAVLLALAIGLGFAYLAIYRTSDESAETDRRRQALMAQREALLDEVIRLEDGAAPESSPPGAASPKKGKAEKSAPRTLAQARADLEDVYRKLDEVNG